MTSIPTITCTPGQYAQIPMQIGKDSNNNTQAETNRTATVDQPSLAYVAVDPTGANAIACVVRSVPAPGASTSVNVTLAGKDANGNPLPTLVAPVVFQGPPPPPLAVTQFVNVAGIHEPDVNQAPPDPGTSTISY